jgi:hypothetical protein
MPLLQALMALINPSQFKIYTYMSTFRYALLNTFIFNTKGNTSISAQTMTSAERLKHGKTVHTSSITFSQWHKVYGFLGRNDM